MPDRKPANRAPVEEVELSDEEKALLAGLEPEDPPQDAQPKKRAEKEPVGPYPGHPLAPPAQFQYDNDPWGGLPVQMRHDEDGNPVG